MKNKIAIVMLCALACLQAGIARADEPAAGGPLTRSGHPAWKVCSFPLRFATGAGGMMVGAIVNGSKSMAASEQELAGSTFAKGPAMYPLGVLGSVIAAPIGFVAGIPDGAAMGGRHGFQIWDHL